MEVLAVARRWTKHLLHTLHCKWIQQPRGLPQRACGRSSDWICAWCSSYHILIWPIFVPICYCSYPFLHHLQWSVHLDGKRGWQNVHLLDLIPLCQLWSRFAMVSLFLLLLCYILSVANASWHIHPLRYGAGRFSTLAWPPGVWKNSAISSGYRIDPFRCVWSVLASTRKAIKVQQEDFTGRGKKGKCFNRNYDSHGTASRLIRGM